MALTTQQSEELRTVIERRREALMAEIRGDIERLRREQYGELAGQAPDRGDESVAALISDLDHAEVSRDLTELRAFEAARERLAQGTYGQCADCGGEIEYERLRAFPAAARCIRCQRRREKTYAGAGGSTL